MATPLPEGVPIQIQAQPQPGNYGTGKLKQAMLVRMSTETLEALESGDNKLNVEFGDNPGLWIGETFFPMRGVKEDTPHELYLRQTMNNKPDAPFRLHGNITGKFTVVSEAGLDRIRDKMREGTASAKNARGQAIMLDAPPPMTTAANAGKKPRKAQVVPPPMFKKPVQVNAAASASGSTSRLPSSSSSPSSLAYKDGESTVRQRLIHVLAMDQQPLDVIITQVGGVKCGASDRREIEVLLPQVAEQLQAVKSVSSGNRPWRLVTESWLEVRPFEWPGLTDAQRTHLARQARHFLSTLGVKDTDERWGHVRHRPTKAAAAAPDAVARKNPTESSGRQGLSGKDVKEKKSAKLKEEGARGKMEIQMKDETKKSPPIPVPKPTVKPGPRPMTKAEAVKLEPRKAAIKVDSEARPVKVSTRESSAIPKVPKAKPTTREPTTTRAMANDTPAASSSALASSSTSRRAPPGSGFKATKASTPMDGFGPPTKSSRERAMEKEAQKQAVVAAEKASSNKIPRMKKVEAVEPSKSEAPVRKKRIGEDESERDEGVKSAVPRMKRAREDDSERENAKAAAPRMKKSREAVINEPPKATEKPTAAASTSSSAQKRKQFVREEEEEGEEDEPLAKSIPIKRRKAEETPSNRPPPPRDLSLPKKPDLAPPPRPSSIVSPVQQRSERPRERRPSTVTSTRHASPLSVSRPTPSRTHERSPSNSVRRTANYTSSEDSDSHDGGNRRRGSSADLPGAHRIKPSTARRSTFTFTMPKDADGMRDMYGERFNEWMANFRTIALLKQKMTAMVKKVPAGSTGSVSDDSGSEGDVQLVQLVEISKLTSLMKRQEAELGEIMRVWQDGEGHLD